MILPSSREAVARLPAQLFVVQQCQEQCPRPHLSSLVLDRGRHPGAADELIDLERERGRPLVARAKSVDDAGQVAEQVRGVDLEVAEDPGQVAVRQLGQLDQPVLDLDAGVGPRQAKPGRRLQGVQASLVQVLIRAAESTPMIVTPRPGAGHPTAA